MAQTPTLDNPSALTQRSPIKVILFTLITFGLYGFYWLYQVNTELEAATSADYNPTVRTLLAFVIIGIWQFTQTAESVTDQSGAILFVLWIVFAPAAMYLIASGMNEAAA